jgi:hypothetical protein
MNDGQQTLSFPGPLLRQQEYECDPCFGANYNRK